MASTDEYRYLPSRDGIIEISKETGEPVVLQDMKAELSDILIYNNRNREKVKWQDMKQREAF